MSSTAAQMKLARAWMIAMLLWLAPVQASAQSRDDGWPLHVALGSYLVLAQTDAIQTADQVTNAALQVATGIQATFSKKLKQLTDVLKTVGDIAKLFHNAQQALDTLRDMTVKIEWQPKIGSYVLPDLNWTIFRPASQHALTLLLEARAKATPNKSAGVDISCRLDHFDLCLGPLDADQKPVVGLQFDHISFAMEAGKKPDVDVKINGIVFGGPLSWRPSERSSRSMASATLRI